MQVTKEIVDLAKGTAVVLEDLWTQSDSKCAERGSDSDDDVDRDGVSVKTMIAISLLVYL